MGLGLDMLYACGAAVTSPLWATRLATTGKWRTDWPGRFGRARQLPDSGRPTVLIHAVSVGEVNATRSLVEQLHAQSGGRWRIVISATTNTGIARARQLFEPMHTVVRFPLDFSCCVSRFLDAIRPDVVALIELEVWPNFVQACGKRSVPVCVVNGRLSERSFRRYRLVASALRPTFARLAAAAVQTESYAYRFRSLGVPADRVMVTDSMKWDTAPPEVTPPEDVTGAAALAADMGIDRSRPLIVAGSTGPGEERMLIDTKPAGAQLMLVPRRPERFEEVARLAPGMVRRTARAADSSRSSSSEWTSRRATLPQPLPEREGGASASRGDDLFLLDTMGELRKAYALADIAIVGRSFLGLHGSDPIEPIALGKPTLIGPHHSDFADIVSAFQSARGIEVTPQPCLRAAELLADPVKADAMAKRGREVIRKRQGATHRHVELITRLMTVRGSV